MMLSFVSQSEGFAIFILSVIIKEAVDKFYDGERQDLILIVK